SRTYTALRSAATKPAYPGDPVSARTRRGSAMPVTSVPTHETSWPPHRSMKFRLWRRDCRAASSSRLIGVLPAGRRGHRLRPALAGVRRAGLAAFDRGEADHEEGPAVALAPGLHAAAVRGHD